MPLIDCPTLCSPSEVFPFVAVLPTVMVCTKAFDSQKEHQAKTARILRPCFSVPRKTTGWKLCGFFPSPDPNDLKITYAQNPSRGKSVSTAKSFLPSYQ